MMGVDYDLFWTLTPKSLTPFIKAFDLSEKNKDMWAWQQGQYIQLAIASVMGKGSKYPSQPILMENESKSDPKKMQDIIKDRFIRHSVKINAQMKKEVHDE